MTFSVMTVSDSLICKNVRIVLVWAYPIVSFSTDFLNVETREICSNVKLIRGQGRNKGRLGNCAFLVHIKLQMVAH